MWQMWQMSNIWHICHTKYKNEALSDVSNSKNYKTPLQYHLKYETVRTDVAKIFIVLYSLFSLLSLHFFFSLLSHSPVPSLFDQSGMFTSSDDGIVSTTTARSATLDLTHFRSQPRSILPISPRGCRRSHPLPSPLCPPFTLPLSGCGGFYFFLFFIFFAAIWVDLILVSNCGGWFAVEVLLRQWILVVGGCWLCC